MGLILLCFSLTHAGATKLFDTIGKEADIFVLKHIEAPEVTFVLHEDILVEQCHINEDIIPLPLKKCSSGDCHFIYPSNDGHTNHNYLHVIYRNIKEGMIKPITLRFLRPPIG